MKSANSRVETFRANFSCRGLCNFYDFLLVHDTGTLTEDINKNLKKLLSTCDGL